MKLILDQKEIIMLFRFAGEFKGMAEMIREQSLLRRIDDFYAWMDDLIYQEDIEYVVEHLQEKTNLENERKLNATEI